MDSAHYRFYMRWLYPIEHTICRLWPGMFAFQLVTLAQPVAQRHVSPEPERAISALATAFERGHNMFIASFGLKTSIQRWLFTLQDFGFPRLHPAREMKRLALNESVQYAQKRMRTAVGMESSREVLKSALGQVTFSGHYLEFGVTKGAPSIAAQAGSSRRRLRQFAACRTWTGVGFAFDAHGTLPKVPGNVVLHPGFFADTLPGWLEQHPVPRHSFTSTPTCTNPPAASLSFSRPHRSRHHHRVRRVFQLPELASA